MFLGFYKRVQGVLLIFCIFALAVLIAEAFKSEIFKSKKVLEAILQDDLFSEHLTLRENNTFEIISTGMFDEEKFKGSYQKDKNKIIFSHNMGIQDTVTMINDRIILKFNNHGEPNSDFACFYTILFNHLSNF